THPRSVFLPPRHRPPPRPPPLRARNAQSLAPLFSRAESRMKILLSSHFFSPSVGGIEAVSEILAREFTQAGHEVRVITQTPANDDASFPFTIFRRPDPAQLWRLVCWCDVFFHNNISLQVAWP